MLRELKIQMKTHYDINDSLGYRWKSVANFFINIVFCVFFVKLKPVVFEIMITKPDYKPFPHPTAWWAGWQSHWQWRWRRISWELCTCSGSAETQIFRRPANTWGPGRRRTTPSGRPREGYQWSSQRRHPAGRMVTSSNEDIPRVSGHLCGKFTGDRWIPRTNASEGGALMFSLICSWINGWVNIGEAGDSRHHRAH